MHDPMTVAWEIKSPFKHKSGLGDGYWRPAIVTVWHNDPERDGSDDSCGWFTPKLTQDERDKIKQVAKEEAKALFDREEDGDHLPKLSPESMVWNLMRALYWRVYRKRFKPRHLPDIMDLQLSHWDNFSDTFRRGTTREDDIVRTCYFMCRALKRMDRPWWQHPRYHFWHYSIQIHPLQAFKRWAFSRCCKCGGRFTYGYSPVSTSWHGTGPRWFRSEPGVYHSDCDNQLAPQQVAAQ